jgi:hypothetical protein
MEVFIHEHLGHGLAGSVQSTKHLSPTLRHRARGCSGVWQEALSLSCELCLKTANIFHSKDIQKVRFSC